MTHPDYVESLHNANAIEYREDVSVFDALEGIINRGVIETITVTDDGTLDISWTSGRVVTSVGDIVNTTAGSGTCTADLVNHLIWSSGVGLTLQTADPTVSEVAIASIVCQDGDIWELHTEPVLQSLLADIHHGLGELIGTAVASGLIVSEDTSGGDPNPLDVAMSAGEYYRDGHDEIAIASQVRSGSTPMVRWFHSGSAWTSDTNAEIDATKYDDGSDLTATTAARYLKSVFFVTPNPDTIHWVYPQEEHVTLAQAIAGAIPTLPPGLQTQPTLTSVVMKGNDAAFPTAGGERWIDERPLVGGGATGGAITDHGSLAGLTDDDHTQYLLVAGTRAMTGALDMGTNDIKNTTQILDATGNEVLALTVGSASAVNHIDVLNSRATISPSVRAVGDDPNIDLVLTPKGAGTVATAANVTLTAGGSIVTTSDGNITLAPSGTGILDVNADTTITGDVTLDGTTPVITLTAGGSIVTTAGGNIAIAPDGIGKIVIGNSIDMNGQFIGDGGGLELLEFGETASAVNHLKITNAIATAHPRLDAVGSDTDINLVLASKGDGNVYCEDDLEVLRYLRHQGVAVGFYGTTPAAQSAAWTFGTGYTPRRTLQSTGKSADTLAILLEQFATLVSDLQLTGILG